MGNTTHLPPRNIAPWADFSTMRPQHITSLLTQAARQEVRYSRNAAEARYYRDEARAERDRELAAWWEGVKYAAMFSIEDRLEASDD